MNHRKTLDTLEKLAEANRRQEELHGSTPESRAFMMLLHEIARVVDIHRVNRTKERNHDKENRTPPMG